MTVPGPGQLLLPTIEVLRALGGSASIDEIEAGVVDRLGVPEEDQEREGFLDVQVTPASRDGGVDGYAFLPLPLVRVKVAFECKRWEKPVGRRAIQLFRGAHQARSERGIFLTTSDFTTDAKVEAGLVAPALYPITLISGVELVRLFFRHNLFPTG